MGWLSSLFSSGEQKPPAVPKGRSKPGAAYMRGTNNGIFSSWNPILRDPKEDVRAAWWQSAARTTDMLHNSGWIAGVVNKGAAAMMGTGLRLSSKPDFEALKWDINAANDWARMVERRWELWSTSPLECDAAGKSDIHQLCKAAIRSYFAFGEWVAWYRWIERPESKTGTKIHLIPAHRLSSQSNNDDIWQGVRVNNTGLPRSYIFNLSRMTGELTEIKARDKFNRQIINHCFDGDVGQMRGISVFAPVLQTLKQYDQLANATLSAALLQTIIAATIESPAPTPEVLQAFETMDEQGFGGGLDCYMDAKAGWSDQTNIDLGGLARVVHLFGGEKLDLKRSETPNSNYEAFSRWLLREIAACAGFTTEDLTGDYTGATYSSVKMASNTNWPMVLWRRNHIAAPFYAGAYSAWLEESIERGDIPFPGGIDGFLANREAACRAGWRGPTRPIPDETKFSTANEMLYSMGVVSAEFIASELGQDIEDVYDQLAKEKTMREELGLPEPTCITPAPDPVEVAEATAGIREQAAQEKAKESDEAAPKPKPKRAARVRKPINGE